MRKLFNRCKEVMFRGTNSKLSIAYRTYMITLFLTIFIMLFQNTEYRYNGNKVMLVFYLIIFLVIPIILAVATLIKGAKRIRERTRR